MSVTPRLADLQRAFHALATGAVPAVRAAGLIADGAATAAVRVGVYAHAYRARLHGVLALDHPRLRAALGDDDFATLVDRYLAARPPRHPSIAMAGAALPAYLAGATGLPAWLAELVELERVRLNAFVAADARPASREHLVDIPAAVLPTLLMRVVPSAVLVVMAWNTDELWDALAPDAAAARPPVRYAPRTVLVWRRDTTVIHRTVEPDEADALAALAHGATFAAVCEALAGVDDPAARAIELLVRWIDAAVIAAIE